MHNADEIHPEWQQRGPGEIVFLHPRSGLRVTRFEPGRILALEHWGAFVLEPRGRDCTRLMHAAAPRAARLRSSTPC
jgi:hypothetical protein